MTASSSPQIAEQLAQLRDIRLPQDISWWPLAPGWWIALGLLVSGLCAVAIFIAKRRRSLKYVALRELERLRKQNSESSSIDELATEVGILLRRAVLRLEHDCQIAQVHGDAWQSYLTASPDGMPDSVAEVIATAPYAPIAKLNGTPPPGSLTREALLDASNAWIRRHL